MQKIIIKYNKILRNITVSTELGDYNVLCFNWSASANMQASEQFRRAWKQTGYLMNFIMHLQGWEIYIVGELT